ncbi:GMC family oxidoreductase [Noviherbaspirillum saxi]|uniref:long-chain-alcohol oxidase n=1 Tax=Noviherbaspirillum saxi TaxID=2320863 RepID=A0A3A3FRJ3_9BURK|nr:GMC family oxidoreductase [Noviherbaspirillum saxi]RJF98832.1 GMC family oxidoreductase [Noviherbaspirillum saxi]
MAKSASSSPIPDPIQAGLASGWKVIDASTLVADREVEADVAIIGTGAGGGVTAEILALAGLKVVLVEEGPLKSSKDFKMHEAEAYPELYQESAARKTRDKAINILQGRNVGGSTTVNWTSSFRTPGDTLSYWQKNFGLNDYSAESLSPWFTMMEQRLHIGAWAAAPNENNDLLRRGAAQLGIPAAAIQRNVKACWNLGYCGMGCPTNAKQSMLVTTIPSALARGATLFTRTRADKLLFTGDKVHGLSCVALNERGLAPTGHRIHVRAKHYVVAGGAINSPALLLRSGAPDPQHLLGKRTFLHPTVISAALHDKKVDAYAGAPQTIYSDHFLQTQAIDGAIGYKLEAPPLHPLLFASTMSGFGVQHAAMMKQFAHTHALLALLRDGFHDESCGGTVSLQDDGSPVLDYPISAFVWDGVRRALLSMAEIQFAAGAKAVYPVHEEADGYSSWNAARKAINALAYEPLKTRVVSAHVMGGCTMSDDPKQGIVSSRGRYHELANLSVHDGSLFPTSIGANPQLSIYGITAKLASGLATDLTGKPPPSLPLL